MGAIAVLALGGLRRRRLQGGTIASVLLLGTMATTIALSVLVGSRAPFEAAFTAANGAHLVIAFDGDLASESEVAATAAAAGVVASAGPWPAGSAGFVLDPSDAGKGGLGFFAAAAQVSGRPEPTAAVDQITLLAGRWWAVAGEIVLSRAQAQRTGMHVGSRIGLQQVQVRQAATSTADARPTADPPPTTTFTVVGIAASISTPDVSAWMSPTDLIGLQAAGVAPRLEMLYRTAVPDSSVDLATTAAAITAMVPDRAASSVATWLALRTRGDRTADLMVPILLAFGAFAFLAAAFIVVNVVSGVVIGSLRQIGLMKAVGYAPRQVSGVLVGQIAAPAAVGAVAGTLLGVLASQPILADTATALGVPGLAGAPPTVLVGVPALALLVVLAAALGPAWRAGRIPAAAAITRGSSASTGTSTTAVRAVLLRRWLPPAVSLGLGRMLARPLRTLMTLGALVVGIAALSFTFGMESSLRSVGVALFRDHASPVRAELRQGVGPRGTLATARLSDAEITAAIAALAGTDRSVAIGQVDATVARIATPVPLVAYQGDASWLGYEVIEGRWFSAPGEVVAPTNFLAQSGLTLGDRFTVEVAGRPLELTLVGSIFDDAGEAEDNLVLRAGWDTVASVDPTLAPSRWEIVNRGDVISPSGLAYQIRQATSNAVDAEPARGSDENTGFLFFEGVIAMLGLVLVGISLGGVVNTVLLDARERARETAILRAVGMTPGQTVAMAVASVAPLGVLGAIVGIPAGLVLQRAVIVDMGRIAIASEVPASLTNVGSPVALVVLTVAGLAIAALGAWLPARRTSHSPIAPVLQAE